MIMMDEEKARERMIDARRLQTVYAVRVEKTNKAIRYHIEQLNQYSKFLGELKADIEWYEKVISSTIPEFD